MTILQQTILQRLEKSCWIVPTQSMARRLKLDYAALQIDNGRRSWPSPRLYSWSSLLKELYQLVLQRSDQMPRLLNTKQQHYLWQQVLRQSRTGSELLNFQATVRQVIAAYQICAEWRIPVFAEAYSLNRDAFSFRQWHQSYQLQLKSLQACDEQTLLDELLQHRDIILQHYPEWFFYAFDQLTPQQQYFIDSVRSWGGSVELEAVMKKNQSCLVRPCQDQRDEIRQAARWAKEYLQQNPQASVGIVIRDLHNQRKLLHRELSRYLGIPALTNTQQQSGSLYSLSVGAALLEYPIIDQIFRIINVMGHHIKTTDLSPLLHSSFIKGWQQEADARALLDKELRARGVETTTLAHLSALAESLPQSTEHFIACITELQQFANANQHKKRMREWAEFFTQCLKVMSWPGEIHLNSDEYQTFEAWQKALQEFVSLQPLAEPCYQRDAIAQLRLIMSQTSFQPETGQTPIQLLSSQAVSGMGFDAVWLMGMDDQNWPQKEVANPFIPLAAQRQAGVSVSSPELSLQASRAELQAIVNSTPEVVLSYAQKLGDQQLRASPLICDMTTEEFQSVDDEDFYTTVMHSRKVEAIKEVHNMALPSGRQVSGGAGLFQDQADCPFRAFAKHRLFAESIESPSLGLDARARGIIMHEALQNFWQRLRHSEQLQRLSDTVLHEQIQDAVRKAIEHYQSHHPGFIAENLLTLETERQCRLMQQWITLEKKRQSFSVMAVEKSHRVRFHDLFVNLRIDRIDENADGTWTIIDYKSSESSVTGWYGERIDQPQLPLYAVTSRGRIAACLFATVKTGDIRFIGLADSNERIENIKAPDETSWEDLIQQWEVQLGDIAEEFKQGRADVSPRNIQACTYCDLFGFCRYYERKDVADVAYDDEPL